MNANETKTMQPTTNTGFTAKEHFGVLDAAMKVELMLTTEGYLIQIRDGKWSDQPGAGMAAEAARLLILSANANDVVRFFSTLEEAFANATKGDTIYVSRKSNTKDYKRGGA